MYKENIALLLMYINVFQLILRRKSYRKFIWLRFCCTSRLATNFSEHFKRIKDDAVIQNNNGVFIKKFVLKSQTVSFQTSTNFF